MWSPSSLWLLISLRVNVRSSTGQWEAEMCWELLGVSYLVAGMSNIRAICQRLFHTFDHHGMRTERWCHSNLFKSQETQRSAAPESWCHWAAIGACCVLSVINKCPEYWNHFQLCVVEPSKLVHIHILNFKKPFIPQWFIVGLLCDRCCSRCWGSKSKHKKLSSHDRMWVWQKDMQIRGYGF